MIPMRADEIASAAGAVWCRPVEALPGHLEGADGHANPGEGRTLRGLKGERYDAHDFLDRAMARGAAALLVSRISPAQLERAAAEGTAVLRAAAP